MDERDETVRTATFKFLREVGVTKIFGNPGSTELPMFRDFPKDFQYILGLQEATATAMADGYAQASRQAAIVSLHSAAGLGNALGGVFTAYMNRSPLIVIAGQQARSIFPFEPFLFAREATEFPKPYVKWSCEPARAEDVPAAIARAYYTAMQSPMGPTFLSIPLDDWDVPCEPIAVRKIANRNRGDADLLAEAARAIASAQRLAIIVGADVARDEAWDEVIQLAERHQASVWAAPVTSRNNFPEDHALFAGFLPASREPIVALLKDYDAILVAGAPIFSYHVAGAGPHLPESACLYQLVNDPSAASRAPVGTAIVTDLKAGIAELLNGPAPPARPSPTPRPKSVAHGSGSLTDGYLMQQIEALRPVDSIIVEEAPSSRRAMNDYLPMRRRDGFYTTASGGLGFGLPASVGIALASRQKVIACVGDGSCMYSTQGLWTAAQLGLPISFIIVNNQRYEALIQFKDFFGIPEIVGDRLPGLEFCDIARGHGLTAEKVGRADDLIDALTRSFGSDKPNLVEVMVA